MDHAKRIRQAFIFGLGAFGLTARPALAALPASAPDLTIGIVSDVHIGALPGDDGRQNYTVQRWRKVLAFFRDCGVDGVLVAGDLTVRGLVCELELFARVWYEVFPDGRLPLGSGASAARIARDRREPRHALGAAFPRTLASGTDEAREGLRLRPRAFRARDARGES